eukprot:jgi/Chlat1/1550/Chrsp122S01827
MGDPQGDGPALPLPGISGACASEGATGPPAFIQPSTRLYNAFASRAPEDAAVIRRLYGNRTMGESLLKTNTQPGCDGAAQLNDAAIRAVP